MEEKEVWLVCELAYDRARGAVGHSADSVRASVRQVRRTSAPEYCGSEGERVTFVSGGECIAQLLVVERRIHRVGRRYYQDSATNCEVRDSRAVGFADDHLYVERVIVWIGFSELPCLVPSRLSPSLP